MKFLIVLLAVAATAIASEDDVLSCIPLARFKLDCNDCFCGVDGKASLCTLKGCHPNGGFITYLALSDKPVPANTRVCKPRSTFRIRCNDCTCGEDGTTYQCTDLPCGKEVMEIDGSVTVLPDYGGVTTPEQVCQPLSAFKYYCNTCFCAIDGKTFGCTRMACDINVWKPDGSLKIVPHPNRVTRSASKQVCQPRTTFKDYCNSCTCSPDGTTYACTRMACDKDTWNPDGSLKIVPHSNRVARSAANQEYPLPPIPPYKPNCIPGTRFSPDGCNTCYCDESGFSGCTRMLCPVYPKPLKWKLS